MQSTSRIILTVFWVALAVCLASLPMEIASAQQGCAPLSGTIYGHHQMAPPAWVGYALLRIGQDDPLGKDIAERASFIDRSAGSNRERLLAGLPFRGEEVITFTFADDSTLDVAGQFVGVPASTPGLYTLNETGEITNGTGRFLGATGHVSVHGPFLSPLVDQTPPWIAEMHGSICGVVQQ